VYRKPKKLQRL